MKGVGLALSPQGRRVIRGAVQVAQSDEARKVAARARQVATSPESRKLVADAVRVASHAGKVVRDPETRERLRATARLLAERRR